MRFLLGSFACCILVSGAVAQNNVTVVYVPAPEPQPSVVILRERPPVEPAQFQDVAAWPGQITYLIASKDNVVRLAAQYWVNGRTLFYLTASHQQKSMPIDSVDRTLSARLNREQNVTFSLPAEQEKTIVAIHQIRSTTPSVRKQCFCVSTHSTGKASRQRSAARVSQ